MKKSNINLKRQARPDFTSEQSNTKSRICHTLKRVLMLLAGLLFMGIGVAFTRRGDLGISPISSVPNVISYRFTFFTVGTWLIIWNILLIICQIIVLKKEFKPYQLLQIVISFLFGYFTDFGVWLSEFIPNSLYISKLAFVASGTLTLGLGISFILAANLIMCPGEAIVKVISDKTGKKFANVKSVFDVSCVILSVILSLLIFDFRIVGTREGTVIAALCTGLTVKLFSRLFHTK